MLRFGMMRDDAFGDRMKAYEAVEDRRLDCRLPIYARIDGRSFSRFTRGMERPFDPAMTAAMVAATRGLVGATNAKIGYAQSDEISLIWLADEEGSQGFFDGRIQKLASVLASIATAHFTAAICKSPVLSGYADRLPHFDCRVLQLPSREEAANMLLWREMDARKNAISMATRAHYSAKAMHGKSGREMLEMLANAGVDFDAYPVAFTRGSFLRRVSFERALTVAELGAIPEKHRPSADALVTRSEVRLIAMPPFSAVANRSSVIFDGAEPTLAAVAA